MDNNVLEVRGLEKSYGRRKVVHDVSFRVGQAEIVGLLGPNGAGKSTSFKMTCGIVKPDRGQVFLGDNEVTEWPMFRRANEGRMGYLAQESSVFRKLSVEQNILAIYELLGVPYRERRAQTESLLNDFEITHIRRSKASRLSGGERRRLEIARCLVTDPQIVMLDEPFAGIDPVTVQNIQEIILKLRDRGIAILITDHAAREILQTVDRCYVISKGKVLCEGNPDSIMQHPDVRKEYLGDISEHFQQRPSVSPVFTKSSTITKRIAEVEAEAETVDDPLPSAPSIIPAPRGWFRRKERSPAKASAAVESTSAASLSKSSLASGPAILPMQERSTQRPSRRKTDV
jgi:lipopolysaccharide export system ATP-binding protein